MSQGEHIGKVEVESIPIRMFPGFTGRILPLLALYWIGAILISFTYRTGLPLVLAGWLTPTTIMLWPVSRKQGLKYSKYRRPGFIISVASMVGVPLTVLWIISTPFSETVVKHLALVVLIVVVIGAFGIVGAHRKAFGKPVKMLFRPDIIMGSNRILAGGLAAIAIGMKFIFSNGPPGNTPIGNWYAFFIIIILGLYQLIPLRGMAKMKSMISRMIYGRKSVGQTALREIYLIAATSLMLFGAHNFFGGVTPFTKDVLKGSTEGLAIMLISGALCVILRTAYKRHIGDPFIKETYKQSVIKDSILAVFMLIYFYGFISVMTGAFPPLPNNGSASYLTLIGAGLVAWGVILLVPLRGWARQNVKFGLMEQMMVVLLPSMKPDGRKAIMGKIIRSISELPDVLLLKIVRMQMQILQEVPDEQRTQLMSTQIEIMSELTSERRMKIMNAMEVATHPSTST